MKKYICIGGYIRSMSDHDIHYVHSYNLPALYKVNSRECIFAESDQSYKLLGLALEDFKILRPLSSGNYYAV